MLNTIYTTTVFIFFANVLGALVSEYFKLDNYIVQFFWTDMIIHFFVIYLPLIFITVILNTKKIIDIKSFFTNQKKFWFLTAILLLAFLAGYLGYFININLIVSYILYKLF